MNWRAIAAGLVFGLSALGVGALVAERRAPTPSESSRPSRPTKDGSASLHGLRSIWTIDDHQRLTLAALEGHYQVMALMFTSCSSFCPTLVKQIQAMDQQLPARIRERIRFVLISIDSGRDTPEQLRAYRQRMGLDARRWRLLRGAPGDVRELAAVLGFNYEARRGADIAHSQQVTVLNPRGEIIHQQSEAGQDSERLIESIRRAMSSEAAPRPGAIRYGSGG